MVALDICRSVAPFRPLHSHVATADAFSHSSVGGLGSPERRTAASSIGAGAAANAPKDGYTILIANQDFVIQPIKAKVPYDVFKSFTAVIEIATAPEMIVVNPSLPAKSMTELVSPQARCRPGPTENPPHPSR